MGVWGWLESFKAVDSCIAAMIRIQSSPEFTRQPARALRIKGKVNRITTKMGNCQDSCDL
jgi:hypothetical protein